MSPLHEVAIFNTFVYKYRQNLVSKITNSDKSQAPQFRETAVGRCLFFLRFIFGFYSAFHFLLSPYFTRAVVLFILADDLFILADACFTLAVVLFILVGVLFSLAEALSIWADAYFTLADVLFILAEGLCSFA